MHRRTLLGGAGLAGLAGFGTWAYRVAPHFWNQYSQDLKRDILPSPFRPDPQTWGDRGLYAAWLGHSTVLLKIDGSTVLTDPVFGPRAGIDLLVTTLGPKRIVQPALRIEELPKIDLLLLSHAHMDHFDLPSLRKLESRGTAVITAARTADLLRVHRYKSVHELAWGDRVRVGPFEVRAFEVNHWGARLRTDTYRGYNAYSIEVDGKRVLFGGDTADTTLFRAARGSKPFDLAMMPVGAYNPWIRYHCTPEQAWRMAGEANSEFFLPIHHQTFPLSSEPVMEPIERTMDAAGNHPDRVAVQRVGQVFKLG